MRIVSEATTAAWKSPVKAGPEGKPTVRATIQVMDIKLTNYARTYGTPKSGPGCQFASILFGQTVPPVELPNVKSLSWERNVDQEIATFSMELWNCAPLRMGDTPTDDSEFDQPGFYTYNRGDTNSAATWGYTKNDWTDMLVPDRIIRTYEGYGFDYTVIPEHDDHLYLTGVWLIDDVDYPADGIIRLRGRDVGRELVEQIFFPPVLPTEEYPIVWEQYHEVINTTQDPGTPGTPADLNWNNPTGIWDGDSNQVFIGKGYTDGVGGAPYVHANGSVYGHHGRHAFDAQDGNNRKSYWLSVGNQEPDSADGFEWVQCRIESTDNTVAAIRVRPWGGPYTVYVSIMVGGVWQGEKVIPYTPKPGNSRRKIDNGARIPFVKKVHIKKDTVDKVQVFDLPQAYANVQKVRWTFEHLCDSGVGNQWRYRAGADALHFRNTSVGGTPAPPPIVTKHIEGNYGDLADIAKWLLAWSGFYWPDNGIQTDSGGGTTVYTRDPTASTALPVGTVWATVENTGVPSQLDAGESSGIIDSASWEKKPILDCFVAGTLVAIPTGVLPIEEVQVGQEVLNADGVGIVTHRRTVQKNRIVHIKVGGESLYCSTDHKFFTRNGWVKAVEIREGQEIVSQREAVQILRQTDCPRSTPGTGETCNSSILQQELQKELRRYDSCSQGLSNLQGSIQADISVNCDMQSSVQRGYAEGEDKGEARAAKATLPDLWKIIHTKSKDSSLLARQSSIGPNQWNGEVLQSEMRRTISGKQEASSEEDLRGVRGALPATHEQENRVWPEVRWRSNVETTKGSLQAVNRLARRESGWTLRRAVQSMAKTWRGVAARILDEPFGGSQRIDLVSNRYCESTIEDSSGSGWAKPSLRSNVDGSGRTQGGVASYARVDSVEVYEPGSEGWAGVCGEADTVTMYDLTVSGHPSFAVGAGQLLAHNCLAQIRDLVQYTMFVDEWGAVVFRSPNIWQKGNYVASDGDMHPGRVNTAILIDEGETLLDFTLSLTSRQRRDRIFISNNDGTLAAGARGFNPFHVNTRRIAGWTDVPFATQREIQVMADLIALRLSFRFTTGNMTIPGNPGIQIDDQIDVRERMTSHVGRHYVAGISSTLDMADGKWTYTMSTHSLGTLDNWWLHDPDLQLSEETLAWLQLQNRV